jgi:predicted nucleic acid-binding protein
MGLVYLDTCLLIYLVQPNPAWSHHAQAAVFGDAKRKFAISGLVKSECLVLPFRLGDPQLISDFQSAFNWFETLEIDDDVFIDAARIRAQTRLKMPDAIHVACAQRHGCTEFWTNDNRLSAFGAWVRVLTPA